jgi:hypothetical protein
MQERELSKALEIAHKQSQTYDLKTQKQSHLIKAYMHHDPVLIHEFT